MKIRIWWQWIKSKPWYLKWFIFFLLVRPIAEQFYDLKNISPLYSPLYWLGVLTFIFSIWGIISRPSLGKSNSLINYWSILIIFSTIAMSFSSSTILSYLNIAIKLSLFVAVYFFLRRFIGSKTDLIGLITTFLFSCIFPVFSLIFGIYRTSFLTHGRYQGDYADVFNFAFYISFGTISLLYIFLLRKSYKYSLKPGMFLIMILFILVLLGLWAIKHMATIAVFVGVISLFIYLGSKKGAGATFITVFFFIIFLWLSGASFYTDVINPRLTHEMQVVEGDRNISQGFHGRVARWQWLTGDFLAAPAYIWFIGYPFTGSYSIHMVAITPHNDFLRIMFFTGIIGLILYLSILTKVFIRATHYETPEKFLVYSVLLTTILYSVSTVPTFYTGFINVLMIIFAYSSVSELQFKMINEKE